MDYPVLYVMVRTELDSMNPGKSQAHSGHAANAAVHKGLVKPLLSGKKPNETLLKWSKETSQGFGTQINLKASPSEISKRVEAANSAGFLAEIVWDPTYPYIISDELYNLLPETLHTSPPFQTRKGWVLTRKEWTAGYIFGMKSEVGGFVEGLKLHP